MELPRHCSWSSSLCLCTCRRSWDNFIITLKSAEFNLELYFHARARVVLLDAAPPVLEWDWNNSKLRSVIVCVCMCELPSGKFETVSRLITSASVARLWLLLFVVSRKKERKWNGIQNSVHCHLVRICCDHLCTLMRYTGWDKRGTQLWVFFKRKMDWDECLQPLKRNTNSYSL